MNNDVRDAIYDDVCHVLEDFDGDIVELYSGVGLLTAQIATRLKDSKITAVEIVPDATRNADALMKSLSLDERVTNVCEDALDFMRKMSEEADKNASQSDEKLPEEITSSPYYLGEEKEISKPSALILDPPRKGCDKDVLEGAKKANLQNSVCQLQSANACKGFENLVRPIYRRARYAVRYVPANAQHGSALRASQKINRNESKRGMI